MTDVPVHGQPAAAPAAPLMPRPGHVTAAGVVHIVAGALTVLFGLIFLLAGAFIGGAVGLLGQEAGVVGGAVTGFIVVLAVIVLGIGALVLITGIKVLGGRSWARVVGIVIAVLGALFSLASLGGQDSNAVLSIAFLVAWAYTAWALFANGTWFESRRALG